MSARLFVILPLVALAALTTARPAAAGVFDVLEPDQDWTLFRPTPRERLRAPVTTTTSPTTVDAGHAQLDVELIDAAWDRDAMAEDPELELFALHARLGLTRRTDLQVMFVPYREAMVLRASDRMSLGRGIGDTTVRLGVNLWGNDGGASAAAVVPFVRLPTATDGVGSGALEGGLAVPIAVRLPAHVEALLIGQVEFADDLGGRGGVHPRMSVTAGLERHLLGPVAAKVDWTTTVDAEDAVYHYEHEVEGQASLSIGKDARVDAGVAVGVLHDTLLSPFLRVVYRR